MMKIEVKDLGYQGSQRYPYTHRVQVSGDALGSDKVSAWLRHNELAHTLVGWGVFYVNRPTLQWLLLRWS